MQKLQALAIAFTFVVMCFSGCLETDKQFSKNRAPEALILMPRQSYVAEAGKPFQIDGSASSDPDGDELNYMWTLSGLGSPIDLSTKMSDFVTIDTPGNDLVLTLLVQDPGGLTNQDIVVINVEPGNRPPVAKIVTPSNGGAYSEGKEVTFDGMASSDPDNDILSYNWDLGEAGGPTYTASKQSKFSLDLEEGDYSVTLTVEDPDGESNSVSHSFSITNLPPVAIISSDKTSVSPASKGSLNVIAEFLVTLTPKAGVSCHSSPSFPIIFLFLSQGVNLIIVVSSFLLWKAKKGILVLNDERISPASLADNLIVPDFSGFFAFSLKEPLLVLSFQLCCCIIDTYITAFPFLSFARSKLNAAPVFFEFGL